MEALSALILPFVRQAPSSNIKRHHAAAAAAAAAVCAHFLVSVDLYMCLHHVLHLNTQETTRAALQPRIQQKERDHNGDLRKDTLLLVSFKLALQMW